MCQNIIHHRLDYKPSNFTITEADIHFKLDPTETVVTSEYKLRRQASQVSTQVFNCDDIKLLEVFLDGENVFDLIQRNCVDGEPDSFTLGNLNNDFHVVRTKCIINPRNNSKLSGLYESNDILVSFNEPHGMRRIMPYIDRPDVMAVFTVTLEAVKQLYPVLLSNGNLREKISEFVEGNVKLHRAIFHDPWPKGPHLFALVAGHLDGPSASFRTKEGRNVLFRVLAEPQYSKQLDWALESLILAAKFDEEQYGRSYDLDVFTAVGVSHFNMGAMENKSLNIFNISALVAGKDRTTDATFAGVLRTVGHEYFHNWSGNRVNVRDWFQITLKEGFTNFRENHFKQSILGEEVSRIGTVKFLRAAQFREDASSTAHPIRPETYHTVDNFYTPTVYYKGSEVIRMYRTLLGPRLFREGTDRYFSTYDGQAVTCDEFRNAMAVAGNQDLEQFGLWYSTKGTPEISVIHRQYQPTDKSYSLTLRQSLKMDDKEGPALHIPIVMGLIGKVSGGDLIPECVLELREKEQTFTVENVSEDAIPSLLRGFSAPVKLMPFLSTSEICHLMTYDSDYFVRWESAQILLNHEILRVYHLSDAQKYALSEEVTVAYTAILSKSDQMPDDLLATYLTLASVNELCTLHPGLSPYKLYLARRKVADNIAQTFATALGLLYKKMSLKQVSKEVRIDKESIGSRSLKNTCLGYLVQHPDCKAEDAAMLLQTELKSCADFTTKVSCASLAVNLSEDVGRPLLEQFYSLCKTKDDNTVDMYFAVEASCERDTALQRVKVLATTHPDFVGSSNPNRLRALVRTFAGNASAFHHPSGEGYEWYAEQLMAWDKFNPAIAAVQAKTLAAYSLYDIDTQKKMAAACATLLNSGHCSPNLAEIVRAAAQI